MKYLSNRIGEKPQHLDVYYLSRLPFAISSFSSIYIYIYIYVLLSSIIIFQTHIVERLITIPNETRLAIIQPSEEGEGSKSIVIRIRSFE